MQDIRNKLVAFLAWGSAALVAGLFLWFFMDIFRQGSPALSFAFLVSEPADAGRSGGIGPILVSTLLILSVALLFSAPLGLGAAIFLSGKENVFARAVRRSLDVLAGVPSIVFGLFGNAVFCKLLGMGFSILSGGLTLACMALPLMIRVSEESLRSVPLDYRLGAAAIGLSERRTLFSILMPVALPGLVAGMILGIGRAIAETAALVFTSGYVDRWPSSLMDSGRALSVHIFDLAMNIPGGDKNAYASSVVLIIVLLVINSSVVWLSHRFRRALGNT